MTSMNDHHFNYVGIANLNESALHFCDSAAGEEQPVKKLSAQALASNTSNSTVDENFDIDVPQLDYIHINWEGSASQASMQVEHSQEPAIIQESAQAKGERTTVHENHFLSTTESADSPVETVEETPITNDFEGSDFNDNNTPMQVEEETKHQKSKKKSDQSKYKNKPKELFQKAVQIYLNLMNLDEEDYRKIMIEYAKSPEQWAEEGDLSELKAKQYSCFAGLCELIPQILAQAGDVAENYNKTYKNKMSQKYFKVNEFDSGDLFSWMLLTQITLVLLPEDSEYIQLLPLKRSTVNLAVWLHESRMTEENKDLYRDSTVRTHLRDVMTEIYNNLMNQALIKMDHSRLTLLQRTSEVLGTSFILMQRGPRRIVKAGSVPSNPQFSEFENGLTGKRGSSRAPKLSKDKTIKKVKNQRK